MALALSLTSLQPANANSEDELRLLREQLAQMAKRLEELETKQSDTQEQVQKTQENAVITSGKSPGSFVLPGSDTSITIYGYVKADLIYDVNEGNGDVFVPEAISTSGKDEQRFRAHARQTRLASRPARRPTWGRSRPVSKAISSAAAATRSSPTRPVSGCAMPSARSAGCWPGRPGRTSCRSKAIPARSTSTAPPA
jgi:TolA-binding protein